MQTVRPSIPITLWNLKWICQGVFKLERYMWNGWMDSRTLVYDNAYKNADCRQKEKKKGWDEEGRSSLMPKPNEILQ
jgi:hypothetical protein